MIKFETEDSYSFQNVNISITQSESVTHTYSFVKRLCDIFLALLGIVLLSPLLLAIAVIIKVGSHGSVIYRQNRVGKDGKPFSIYKFRTMITGAENLEEHLTPHLLDLYKTNRKLDDDPRITKVGRFFRRLSLDELPQMFNILFGDMSIVGPRPLMPEEVYMYGTGYNNYITVKPGLTGLWQIKSRSMTKMFERARLDMEYIENKSLWYDSKILVLTFPTVISRKGAC